MQQAELNARLNYLKANGLPLSLAAPIAQLPKVGIMRQKQLAKLGIYCIYDLLRYFPRAYEDWQNQRSIAALRKNLRSNFQQTPLNQQDQFNNLGLEANASELSLMQEQVFIAQLCAPLNSQNRGKLNYLRGVISDGSGTLDVIWFNQPWLKRQLKVGEFYIFRGKLKLYGQKYSLQNPKVQTYTQPLAQKTSSETTLKTTPLATQTASQLDFQVQPEANLDMAMSAATLGEQVWLPKAASVDLKELKLPNRPIYALTANLPLVSLQRLMEQALKNYAPHLPEIFPEWLRQKYNLAEIKFAYEQVHFPIDLNALKIAKHRLAFEELFLVRLALQELAEQKEQQAAIFVPIEERVSEQIAAFVASLPYRLTEGQQAAWQNIKEDLQTPIVTNRLLQGDVGSGKTIVAALGLLACALAGVQAVMMAPTVILAEQHYQNLQKLFAPYLKEHELVLITSKLTPSQKAAIYQRIASGEVKIVLGTHSVISEKIKWQNLALAVTDEQHRFGVQQRLGFMTTKTQPHLLVMSATPIPRSLALVLYGDMAISTLPERPAERKKTLTYMAHPKRLLKVYEYIEASLKAGQQVYWICPLVSEEQLNAEAEQLGAMEVQLANPGEQVAASGIASETLAKPPTLMAAETRAELLKEVFPKKQIGLVHGKLKEKAKAEAMLAFYNGEIDILVATTVVEVGVDNPHANLIVIENAERFGLAQLHQLRGRVGRGKEAAICILMSSCVNANATESTAYKRLLTLCESDDGFYLAEADLQLRGPGDFFGTRQHGLPQFKIANLYEDKSLIELTSQALAELKQRDPHLQAPEHQLLKQAIRWNYPDLQANVGL